MQNFKKILAAAALTTMVASAAYGWSAIAVDDGEGIAQAEVGYGSVTKSPTKDAASAAALAACKDEGNDDCAVVLAFQNCGAYAASTVAFGTGTAMTLKDAEQSAVTDCGDKDCKIVVSDCE